MSSIADMLRAINKYKWSGEIKIRLYFGAIKNIKVSTTLKLEEHNDTLDIDQFIRHFKGN